jgi:hypothetical protein
MALNPYFRFQGTEQNVVEDNIIEIIRMMGKNLWYIPRENVNLDRLFGEDPLNKFTKTYQIEMYVASTSGFGGGDTIGKFGLEVKDTLNLIVSKKRFIKEITEKSSNIIRPREGDILYFPLSKTMFEITFVEHELPFYQLDKNYVFTLTCETFAYSMENFNTGTEAVDAINDFKQKIYIFKTTTSDSGLTASYNKIIRGDKFELPGVISGSAAYFRILDFDISGSTMTSEISLPTTVTSTTSGITFRIHALDTSNSYGPVNIVLDDIEGETPPLDYQRGFTGSGSKYTEPIINFSEKDPFSEGNY